MARRLLTALVAVCAIALQSKNSLAEARGFVDRYRELQDVTMGEEEVGSFGGEQTVIEASKKDSTSAKSTSAVHVPHKDASTADHQTVNIEERWTDEDITVLEKQKSMEKDVKINPKKVDVVCEEGEDCPVQEDGDQLQEDGEADKEPELTEDELQAQKEQDENQQIEENFEAYSQLDAAEETKKLQEKEMAKNKKKAEIHLLEPRARSTDRGYGNKGPCGGSEKGPIHYMASTGSRNYIQWKTLKSHKSSNCTVSISSGSENAKDYKIIHPRDDSANHEGKFPCGRKAGFEGKEFRLPNDVTCTNCILQFQQEISAEESIHQCADLTILERVTVDPMAALKAKSNVGQGGCGGVCQNGGQCQNGECNCRDGFEGTFCGEEEEGIAAELVWFFIITIVLLGAVALYMKGNAIKGKISVRFGGNAGRDNQTDDQNRLVAQ